MKNIFIFVIGSTPQIITETLYALRHQKQYISTNKIIVFTTTIGYRSIKESLFWDTYRKGFNIDIQMRGVWKYLENVLYDVVNK